MKILIIQTAFIGDVILATSLVEKLHRFYPEASIDFLVRKGNESLLFNHPKINEMIIWNKKQNKLGNLLKLILSIRKKKYHYIINAHRFASSGLIVALSGAKTTIGFDKNPLSFLYTKTIKHEIKADVTKHEVERNLELIASITDNSFEMPKLYPSESDIDFINEFRQKAYVCIAPASVWFTKQFPKEQWVKLITLLLSGSWKNIRNDKKDLKIYLVGAPNDFDLCESIKKNFDEKEVKNFAGKFSLLQTAALMHSAQMNFVNDSAPLHLCSAMNANVTAIFCSTVTGFGFGPLSEDKTIIEIREPLYCRPCGLHGFKACPQGHFRCAYGIKLEEEAIVL